MKNKLFSSCKKRLIKENKKRAYYFSEIFINQYFLIYLDKYLNKLGKLAKKNGNDLIVKFVDNNKQEIREKIQIVFCSHDFFKKQEYIFSAESQLQLEEHLLEFEEFLNDRLFAQEKNAPYNTDFYKNIIKKILLYSLFLRKELMVVSSVAKTKVQEYWCDRVPPTFMIMSMLLIGKITIDILKLLKQHSDQYETIFNVVASMIVFMAAFYMIYLRLPHAVDGAAKQKASDFYIKSKIQLGAYLSKMIPESDWYEGKVKNSFNFFSYHLQPLNVDGQELPKKGADSNPQVIQIQPHVV